MPMRYSVDCTTCQGAIVFTVQTVGELHCNPYDLSRFYTAQHRPKSYIHGMACQGVTAHTEQIVMCQQCITCQGATLYTTTCQGGTLYTTTCPGLSLHTLTCPGLSITVHHRASRRFDMHNNLPRCHAA